ncbi:LCP family protein [Streptococcus sp. CSL10205-OR2]|uniref:LCP family protein n=1 Tax=Streptococcus sp. CSL10205-OR2 TaxID=2980558 RepID=UPI0021DB3737|nr:LCP family protein [Streptococcus sp. CSL10205-OR2]MCU9533710.1 LCP family protein [Streptococcus sp. CSL10205-OR2]
MARKRDIGLTHHEELRYQYLLKNIHYLNQREEEEFNYLHSKFQTYRAQSGSSNQFTQERQAPQRTSRRRQDAYRPFEYDRSSQYARQRHFEQDDYNQYDDYDNDNHYDSYEDVEDDNYVIDGLPKYRASEKRRSRKQKRLVQRDMVEPTAPLAKKKPRRRRFRFKTFLKLLLALIVLTFIGMVIMFFKGMNDVSSDSANFSPAVEEFFDGQDTFDGTNILVLGSDRRVSQGSDEARTDTIMVVNIGNESGQVKMVSFMRDILVNIEGVSYDDYSYDSKLNSAFAIGEQNDNQGAEFMRQTLKRNFDIDIKYYVMIDFETFAEAIDTLFPNGVAIDAQFSTINGEVVESVDVPDDLRMENGIVPDQTIAVGKQRMDGRTLLNYARFRKDDEGDFGRTKRQQQVMAAVIDQIKDPTKLFTGSAAIGKIYALTSTNVSYPFLISNGLSVVTSGKEGIQQETIPEFGDWIDDYDMYGGQGLAIDFDKYQNRLSELGLR